MNCRLHLLTILSVAYLLTACTHVVAPASTQVVDNALVLPEFPNLFDKKPEIPGLDAVQQLTPEQEQAFLAYFNLPQNQSEPPYLRVGNYLFENTLTLQYEGRTYTAAQTLGLNKGNCMSLAMLTTALAKLANVDITYQLVDSSPVFGLAGSLVSKEVHVKSVVFKRQEMDVDTNAFHPSGGVIIDYFASQRGRFLGNLPANDFMAKYYLNIAAEALEEQDYAKAYWHTIEAFNYNPLDETAWNIMAVVYRRAGELAKAEEIYLFGIEHAEDKLSLLKNYRLLLTSQLRIAEAAVIESRLNSMEDPSPFNWVQLARQSYAGQDYDAALRYFNKALVLAPYLHEAYLGKAQSFYQLGSVRDAERALKSAIENVDRMSTRSLYEAKLMALTDN